WNISTKMRNILVDVWDFGDEEAMEIAKHFLNTKRLIYLFVLDTCLSAEENRIEYWLNIIQSLGGGAPIIIVGNKADMQSIELNKTEIHEKYPRVKNIISTSCVTGQGIDELRTKIIEEVSSAEHIKDKLPFSWSLVKQRLEKIEDNYISYAKYLTVCKEEGVGDDSGQKSLVRFLHDLGIVLNFDDDVDVRLEDVVIINIEWIINGIYSIFNAKKIFNNKGILSLADISSTLDFSLYPSKREKMFILDVMEKFGLCVKVNNSSNKYLIPDLLPLDEPFIDNWETIIAFEYRYRVLPKSVISRFIAQQFTYIYQKMVWRTGAVLDIQGNKALVKANLSANDISIRVNGPYPRDALAIIRATLDTVHADFSGLDVSQWVPIVEYPEASPVKYNDLILFDKENRKTYAVNIGGKIIDLDVKELLNGIERETTTDGIITIRGTQPKATLAKIILIFTLPFIVLLAGATLASQILGEIELIAVIALGLIAIYLIINSLLIYIGAIDGQNYVDLVSDLPKWLLRGILSKSKK
ncbi:MAG: COR domain-containing protein, partial [Candidatus Methanofastidiosia archaeon]